MNVFDLRERLVSDYSRYTRSFIKISDPIIWATVGRALDAGVFSPEPLLQLNPTFQPGGTVEDLIADGTLHDECRRIFRIDKSEQDLTGKPLLLHAHQRDAIRVSRDGKSYVLTSGTGSGKSLTYLIPIVNHVLRRGSGQGIQAIVVYPMNALANSQHEELSKFLERGYPPGSPPVRFARYTGQEKQPERDAIRSRPPDILLTNHMMLELLLTRSEDRELVRAAQGVRFLVFESDLQPPEGFEEFRLHPLSSWIESTFGVRTEDRTARLVRQAPRRLQGLDGAAEELARLTGTDPGRCAEVLKRFLLKGSQLRRSASSRFPIFAFRLHQFFTRGDTVWATIEPPAQRHLELSKKGSKPGEPDKPLFPMVFCRHCGTAYYRVKMAANEHGKVLLPREDRREADDDGSGDAYLYVSESAPWPRTEGKELLDRLPAFLKETTPEGLEKLAPGAREDLPEPVFVDPQGRLVGEGQGMAAALIHQNFLFCLECSCGVAYTKSQRSERPKLATLGVDNRSTATTVLAVRSLIELQADRDLKSEARKLLSFTDNRQDASLQAGHFNDFAQVALLRSALHQATQASAPRGLSHGDLSRSVFEAMELQFDEYVADPDVRGPARNATQDALRRVIDYYLYRDLQRGWRVTAPNLEDCGLLVFDYEGLRGADGLLSEDELWKSGFRVNAGQESEVFVETPAPLRVASPELRDELLRTLLDVLRRALVIKVDVRRRWSWGWTLPS